MGGGGEGWGRMGGGRLGVDIQLYGTLMMCNCVTISFDDSMIV